MNIRGNLPREVIEYFDDLTAQREDAQRASRLEAQLCADVDELWASIRVDERLGRESDVERAWNLHRA